MAYIRAYDPLDQVTIFTDKGARLRWRVSDADNNMAHRALRSYRLGMLQDEPDHVKRFVRRWLPALARSHGWL